MTLHRSFNVLVTGLGPYPRGDGHRIDPNLSYVLTTLLPKALAPNTSVNPSPVQINIITLPYPIKTEYAYIRQFFKDLHGSNLNVIGNDNTSTAPSIPSARHHTAAQSEPNPLPGNVDLYIHLGEARGWDFISIERMAFRQGFTSNWWGPLEERAYYYIPDDKGQIITDLGPSPWDNVPMGLQGALDLDVVAEGANAVLGLWHRFGKPPKLVDYHPPHQTKAAREMNTGSKDERAFPESNHLPSAIKDLGAIRVAEEPPPRQIKVVPHREGGSYCCGFTHYESLANCYANRKVPNVMFCHVPGDADKESMNSAREGILAIIVSAVNEVAKQHSR